MAQVQTVTGPIDSSSLGRTLVHEHIFIVNEEMRQNYDMGWDEEEKI
ncbi:MAG: phosphotriesterase-related protein, partial [Brevibacterium aurantiacum]